MLNITEISFTYGQTQTLLLTTNSGSDANNDFFL
ncbi:hypothetical protein T11_2530 [Trichinella zimbabwensis]|uniref:Uncharacterized protein n=1 Tax=Trichinella zimbabwensis TaxID=268475 RepID=A0A0V1GG76_9BILA|nr:hypothetical protein T11_2530 [Trichinella zimbabwensis]